MTTSIEKWQAATQPASVVEFFRGLFDVAGVRVSDTGEAFTGRHLGDRIAFSDGLDDASVDFVVEITRAQVDRLLEDIADGHLDERERFRIMAALATPATEAALKRPIIRNSFLRSILYRIGRAEMLMHVVLTAPPGEEEASHTIRYEGGAWTVTPGLHGKAPHVYRLTVEDAAEYQRKMLIARKKNNLRTWFAFARWYGQLRKRVIAPA